MGTPAITCVFPDRLRVQGSGSSVLRGVVNPIFMYSSLWVVSSMHFGWIHTLHTMRPIHSLHTIQHCCAKVHAARVSFRFARFCAHSPSLRTAPQATLLFLWFSSWNYPGGYALQALHAHAVDGWETGHVVNILDHGNPVVNILDHGRKSFLFLKISGTKYCFRNTNINSGTKSGAGRKPSSGEWDFFGGVNPSKTKGREARVRGTGRMPRACVVSYHRAFS